MSDGVANVDATTPSPSRSTGGLDDGNPPASRRDLLQRLSAQAQHGRLVPLPQHHLPGRERSTAPRALASLCRSDPRPGDLGPRSRPAAHHRLREPHHVRRRSPKTGRSSRSQARHHVFSGSMAGRQAARAARSWAIAALRHAGESIRQHAPWRHWGTDRMDDARLRLGTIAALAATTARSPMPRQVCAVRRPLRPRRATAPGAHRMLEAWTSPSRTSSTGRRPGDSTIQPLGRPRPAARCGYRPPPDQARVAGEGYADSVDAFNYGASSLMSRAPLVRER